MAIEEMKKVHLVGHKRLESQVVHLLQRLGIVQIINIREKKIPTLFSPEEAKKLEERLTQLNKILNFLSGYEKSNFFRGLAESFLSSKVYFKKEEARHILRTFSEVEAYQTYKNLEEEVESIKIKRGTLQEERMSLEPFRQFPFSRKALKPFEKVDLIWGLIPRKVFLKISPALNNKFKTIWVETFKNNAQSLFLVIVCLKVESPNIRPFLESIDFQFSFFSKAQEGTFEERLKEIEEEKRELDRKEEILYKDIQNLLKEKPKLLLLHDAITSRLEQSSLGQNFSQTKSTFILEGWIKATDIRILDEKLIKIFPELEVAISNPPPEVEPPIALKNQPFIKPFEFITKLYGAPNYFEFDPTPYLAPFFILFLGLCISDAGYGLILLLIGLGMFKKAKLETEQKLIFKIFIFCGVVVIILGLLLGSIFSLDFEHLPRMLSFLQGFRQKVMIFDPMKNIMLFLGICLGIGVFQIYFGILLKVFLLLKRKKIIEALFQELPWTFLLSGLILWLGRYVMGVPDSVLPLANIFMLGGGGAILLFAGRGTKNIFFRLGKGLFKLYGIVGILGDILSYSRLLALGLASTIIGLAVNIVADLFSKIPFLGFILGLIIVLLGHGFNLFISTLGGFAHTLRLQFVEFFSKFYEGGGELFEPFRLENKFTKVG